MLDVNVQNEVLRTSPLLSILDSVISKHDVINPPETITTASTTTISSLMSLRMQSQQQWVRRKYGRDHMLVYIYAARRMFLLSRYFSGFTMVFCLYRGIWWSNDFNVLNMDVSVLNCFEQGTLYCLLYNVNTVEHD
ncbi:hypothetical protein Tco_1387800 [Tanacetum coccineum]